MIKTSVYKNDYNVVSLSDNSPYENDSDIISCPLYHGGIRLSFYKKSVDNTFYNELFNLELSNKEYQRIHDVMKSMFEGVDNYKNYRFGEYGSLSIRRVHDEFVISSNINKKFISITVDTTGFMKFFNVGLK